MRACDEIGDILDLKHLRGDSERWPLERIMKNAIEMKNVVKKKNAVELANADDYRLYFRNDTDM